MKKILLNLMIKFLIVILILLSLMKIFSLTFSLPTTFKEVVLEGILENDQLVITTIDTERIAYIDITTYAESGERMEVEIQDKEIINTLLNNEVRLYRMDKFFKGPEEFDLHIKFYGTTHRFFIGEDYIRGSGGNYKVLDDHNEVYESVKALFEEGNN